MLEGRRPSLIALFVAVALIVTSAGGHRARAKTSGRAFNNSFYNDERGLFPPTLNLATNAIITTNATCGERGPEVYCKLVEHVLMREPQCGVCDNSSSDPKKSHPISYAVDGTNNWWQSPTLQNGKLYEWVTITLDLRQVYQVAYVVLTAANAPRPGNWILERSLDGENFKPWQYYAISDAECYETYGIRPTVGIARYMNDDEVICTSYYSKLNPLENGEIHTSLVNGRPGVIGPSKTLQEFTAARFVRLRLQRIRTLNADLMTLSSGDPQYIDKSVTRRYFYSIKDISIGGHCLCFGHASDCPEDPRTGRLRCRCAHNTCGDSCERCCDLFNQKPWRVGTVTDAGICEKCQCFGHADECFYSEEVAERHESLNIEGKYEGGGVCKDCRDFTTGINCEQCLDGYFRPLGVPQDAPSPCLKCTCDGAGAVGHCVKDDSHLSEGYNPGDCVCRKGFAGTRCEECARGYRRYPSCEPCPCDFAGTVNMDCEGDCICKPNVEGLRCDRCKPSHFGLDERNPLGCTACFCFGVTSSCESSDLSVETIMSTEGWVVTDLAAKRVVRPTKEEGRLTVANDDMIGIDFYFWMAPKEFLGNKINSYGTIFQFSISWIKARGDSAGKHSHGPDVILEGNGMVIGTGGNYSSDNYTGRVNFREHEWYQLKPEGVSGGRGGRRGRKGWVGGPVDRRQFMEILLNIERLLIRAKYHTDQIEGSLLSVKMEIGSPSVGGLKKLKSVEKCHCPPGYSGLSCELCAEGYRRVNETVVGGECRRCSCNNHANSCDPYSGECQNCDHNTYGPQCEFCLPGFYGDPKSGTPIACQRCQCPLEDPQNNFSPTCTAVPISNNITDYVCDKCPPGFTGDKCQNCSNGYFGDPLTPGNFCQPCNCSGNADLDESGSCHPLTGQCLKCIANTSGWFCDECGDGFYGNALQQQCEPCECNLYGSLNEVCDKFRGQCTCKHNYIGQKCERCAEGYGNIAEGCVPCNCHPDGATSQWCDPVSGQCDCKPGVFGAKCDSCLDGYYGFSSSGCYWCECLSEGSLNTSCDIVTGQCPCKTHVQGHMCDRCQVGYWNLASGNGCQGCACNPLGSHNSTCNEENGQCFCKSGVGGRSCNRCLPGYFGFSSTGCRKCEPCDALGHLCHPMTGACVCPPNTEGAICERCVANTWGYDPLEGCKPCNCNINGSAKLQCDSVFGRCICLEGYEGITCNRCRFGYFDFPNCKKCRCHIEGTEPQHCNDLKDCECDDSGQCPCKANVEGKKCRRCKDGTFGLTHSHPKGCFECFCFGRTNDCMQSQAVWSQIVMSEEHTASLQYGATILNSSNGLYIISTTLSHINMDFQRPIDSPVYWELPELFQGDKVSSYNGKLSFIVHTERGNHFSPPLFQSYPLIQLLGNFRINLEYYATRIPSNGHYVVHLHEDSWKVKNNPKTPVTRAMMMIALQNIQHILIRASIYADFLKVKLSNVTLESSVTINSSDSRSSIGVEICNCPPEYNGISCQDPAPGYYRKRKPNYLDSKDILDLVGIAVPCQCNGRSNICDKETGFCLHCKENTTGPYCNLCSQGYYGDPSLGPCEPCACPTVTNSFSESCMLDVYGGFVCTDCEPGYEGSHCESCDPDYYGNPLAPNGKCIPCNCDPRGSLSTSCEISTGQCHCLEGITGRDCSECAERYIITSVGCRSCDDGCVGFLLDEVQYLSDILERTNLTGISAAPWARLFSIENATGLIKEHVDGYMGTIYNGFKLMDDFTVFDVEGESSMLLMKAIDLETKTIKEIKATAQERRDQAAELFENLTLSARDINNTINNIWHYSNGTSNVSLNLESALNEAENILEAIRMKNFSKTKLNTEIELYNAEKLLEKVQKLLFDRKKIENIQKRFSMLWKTHDDMRTIIDNIRDDLHRLFTSVTGQSVDGLEKLKNVLAKIENMTAELEMIKYDSGELINDARSSLNNAHKNFDALQELNMEFKNETELLEKRTGILESLNPLYEEKYVKPAIQHATQLSLLAEDMNELFNSTRVIAAQPMEAVNAYSDIVKALEEAKQAAENARKIASIAYEQVNVNGHASLDTRAKKSKDRSIQLQQEASDITRETIPGIEERLEALQNKMEIAKMSNKSANEYLQDVKEMIRQLNLDIIDEKIQNYTEEVEKLNARISTIRGRLEEIERRNASEFQPRYELIKAQTPEGLEYLSKQIDKTIANITEADISLTFLKLRNESCANASSQIRMDLNNLKNKITLARQRASSIKISMRDDENGTCVRSYQSHLEPSTTSSIVLNYAISTEERNSFLLYMANSALATPDPRRMKEFMALEMVNRKIRFIWNSGGGAVSIEHSLELETNDEDLLKNKKWYKIEVIRINNIATLSVQPTPDGGKLDAHNVTGYSSHDFLSMTLTSSSYFFIGGIPDHLPIKIPSEIKTRKFSGCLYEASVDGKPVGLWNFLTSKGCMGCKVGATEESEGDEVSFNGNGYAIVPQIKRFVGEKYRLQIWFRSLDENALLFFSYNSVKKHFMSLELMNGSILFQFSLGQNANLSLKSSQKYNSGQWIKVIAQMQRKDGMLQVGESDTIFGTLSHTNTSKLLLKDSHLYFGGVPPNFTKEEWPSVHFLSFLGCMKSLQIGTNAVNLFKDAIYGVTAGCKDSLIKIIQVQPKGFLELNGQKLSTNASFAFSFQTAENSSLLMLSSFIGKQKRFHKEQNQDFYSVALKDGKLQCWLNAGNETLKMETNDTYNDGKFHTVSVIKRSRRIELRIDDKMVTRKKFSKSVGSLVIESPGNGGLYFGGVPKKVKDKLQYSNAVSPSLNSLVGHIKDVVFNNKLLRFHEPVSFANVRIGHFDPNIVKQRTMEKIPDTEKPFPKHCEENPRLEFQDQAVKFGDKNISYVQFSKQLNQRFNISFEFRTYYPNGMLLFMKSGAHHKNILLIVLQNGHVIVSSSETNEIKSQGNLNDGQWKKVFIVKKDKRIILKVESKTKGRKFPNFKRFKLSTYQMFVGFYPKEDNIIKNGKKEHFKGCISNMTVNNQLVDLASHVTKNIGQCFVKVEFGAYFPGDAYAIFAERFSFGETLEVSLEFRTTRPNGILLTISEDGGSSALALEINNGSVTMTIDLGDGVPFSASIVFPSPYYICDNRWHNVTAFFAENTVTLKIAERSAFGYTSTMRNKTASGQLFIGGLEEGAPEGVLKSKSNFIGCIRNNIINGKLVDWTDMHYRKNVLLNSCPID